MANYSTLKAAINAVIKTNGQKEITGEVLNQVLNAMVTSLGTNYQFAGVATPSTNPGTPDQNVFYMATQAGTYTNFNATVLPAGISILLWNGSWSSETFFTIESTPTSGSTNFVTSGGVFEKMKLDGGAYDVSAHNGGTTFASLEALLSDANLNTLIPVAVRTGGMSIRFVQTSDNNYIHYNLIADEFTTDVTKWAINDVGVYVENPEFIYVKTDKDDRILCAIKTDGSIYFGAGVPQQVVDYINERIAELSLDEYEDIVAFLNGLEEGDKTLQTLLNEKVDKEEGKSLIDEEYASTKSNIENPEFLEVTTDSEDKVLEGTQQDGTKVIGGNLNVGGSAKILGNMEVSGVSYKVIENPEYLAAWVDAEDNVIFGLKADGKTYIGDADFLDDIESIKAFLANFSDKNIDWDALTSITVTDSSEYIEATTDSEGKLLAGRTPDGAAFEKVGFSTPKLSIDGYTIENIEDPEKRSEISTDAEGKIISYRDSDGVKHEEVGIETDSASIKHLNLTDTGMTEFQQALIDAGFNPKMPIDWSNVKELHLPIPRTCAKINLIVPSLPTTKTADYEGYVEYVDFDGNYFKKKMVLNAQGSSSMAYIEKNYTLDIDDKSKIQFGNWVSQDSFHLKAYYIDVFRGITNVCYKWTNKIIEHLGCRANRVLNNPSSVTTDNGTGTFTTDFGSSALCQPDGFPIEVYHNGTYHGLYALNLKKNRDNYQMKKDNYTQALLDGVINGSTFFGGNIDWTQFELRNPKKLILEDGTTEYEGDNPAEIIGTDSPNYDSSDTDHVNTAVTKAMIEEVADCVATISSMPISTPQEIQAVKTLFESHYDIEMIKCYFILSNVVYHLDGFSKNWIWTIYNGMAAPTFYDMDTVFGRIWYGSGMWGNNTTTHIIGTDEYDLQAHDSPSNIIANLYKDELNAMYKDLRDNGYISVSAIMSQIHEWIGAQTLEAIQRNLKKWTAIPSYRADGGSYPPPLSYNAEHQTEGMYDCPARVEKWLTARLTRLDNYFNYTSN